MGLKKALSEMLSKEELAMLPTGFDTVGDIAILEIPDSLRKKERKIAKALLGMHKHITTVVAKDSPHEGELRTRTVRHLAGEKKTTALHKESGTVMKVDVEKMYFSPRLSHERLRIAQLVKEGERVLVMFSGCGPYCLVIAKNSKAQEVIGVELNTAAHEYAEKNISLNKLWQRVTCFQGNVRDVVPKLGKFDRVAMPLPEGGENFLDVALAAAKKKGIIHFYDFLHESEIPDVALKKVRAACKKAKRRCKILGHTLCGQIGVRKYRVCVDFTAG